MIKVSLIICTHNPREDYLNRTLAGLRAQTLAAGMWELLVIDNASRIPLAATLDLSWHGAARVVREDAVGLTKARLRGIHESTGDLIVFVDDDNVLAPDYVATALALAESHSWLGAYGGTTTGEYDQKPPVWFKRWESYIGVREITKAHWSNYPASVQDTPIGAGMVVRRPVALAYLDRVTNDARRGSLDRSGQVLSSCGDLDLAYTACDLGLAMGVFPSLRLLHLIPPGRCQLEYLERLVEGTRCSAVLLAALRPELDPKLDRAGRLKKIWRWLKERRLPRDERRIRAAVRRGAEAGRRLTQNA